MQASESTIETTTQSPLQRAIDAFWATVPPVWNQIKSNIHSIAEANSGISVEQFHILRHIRRGLTSVSELADVRQISRSATSQMVDLLVERGLVFRRQNAQDRRNIPLELTEAGNKLLDTIWEENRAWMGEKMARLASKELETLADAMDILGKAFTGLN